MSMTNTGDPMSRLLDPSIEAMSRDDLRSYQEARLLESLAYVEEYSPLFADVWGGAGLRAAEISSLEEFCARAPFMDKDTVRAYRDSSGDPLGGLRRMRPASALSSTTGTTGEPVVLPVGNCQAANTMVGPPLLERPYVLMVGTIEVRKNHAAMLRVWRRVKRTRDSVRMKVASGMSSSSSKENGAFSRSRIALAFALTLASLR